MKLWFVADKGPLSFQFPARGPISTGLVNIIGSRIKRKGEKKEEIKKNTR